MVYTCWCIKNKACIIKPELFTVLKAETNEDTWNLIVVINKSPMYRYTYITQFPSCHHYNFHNAIARITVTSINKCQIHFKRGVHRCLWSNIHFLISNLELYTKLSSYWSLVTFQLWSFFVYTLHANVKKNTRFRDCWNNSTSECVAKTRRSRSYFLTYIQNNPKQA